MGSGPMEGLRSRSPDQLASGSFLTMAQNQPLLNPQYLRALMGCSGHRMLQSLISVKLGCRIASFRPW